MIDDSVAYCRQCGSHDGMFGSIFPDLCCFDGTCVDVAAVDALLSECAALEYAIDSEVQSPRLHALVQALDAIWDPRAVPALLRGASGATSRIRCACLRALGLTGASEGLVPLAAALRHHDDDLRRAACIGLARLGGQEAADLLAAQLPDRTPDTPIGYALAWLRDPRALDGLIVVAERDMGQGIGGPLWAIRHIGDPRAVPALCAQLGTQVQVVLNLADDDTSRYNEITRVTRLLTVIRELGGPEAVKAEAEAKVLLVGVDAHLDSVLSASPVRGRPVGQSAGAVLAPRVVPRWSLRLTERTPGAGALATKFGGQPVWLNSPTWPITRVRTPMRFIAQFRIPWITSHVSMAYLFLDPSGEATWDPTAGDSALIVQPGAVPSDVPVREWATGPRHDPVLVGVTGTFAGAVRWERFTEHVPTLAPGLDPRPGVDADGWGDELTNGGDWNKLGGTPCFLQGEDWPPGEGWRFLFQFSMDEHECYGFVSHEGRGWFLQQ